jgi:hypothetical protein
VRGYALNKSGFTCPMEINVNIILGSNTLVEN